ncbi:MAG: Holliday junction ATP-dependent DNA helicase RuvB [Chlamydiales bacterium]|nr:Holliday junction ATP-dependent DNA helicase RuvB [Chlamydiales bacterium]MCH9635469.1 Holliday junction ATP-dependent DNA helicase RuvB [Chlamydiales bacterium]
MKEYQVLARRYRPKKFLEVIGQRAVVQTIKHAIGHHRIAQAYLFCGTRGTGKTTLARLFAMAINCRDPQSGEPCGKCSSCLEIARGDAIDVLEIDGASHRGIEDIRQINEAIKFSPTSSRYKIYIIDEVHMLTKEAFNALLKTLEEPPSHAKFFFATTEVHKIPATILSRTQRFNLRRIATEEIENKLLEICEELGIKTQPRALSIVAKRAEGSLRDAQSLLDQVIAFEERELTEEVVCEVLGLPPQELLFELDAAVLQGDYKAAFEIVNEVYTSGKNCFCFLEELMHHFRSLLLVKTGVHCEDELLASSVRIYSQDNLLSIMELLSKAELTLKQAPSERIALEMLLLQIIQVKKLVSNEAILELLEKGPSKVEPPTRAAVKPTPIKPAVKREEPPKQMVEKRVPPKEIPKESLSREMQGRVDTLMRFAAKELNGSLRRN